MIISSLTLVYIIIYEYSILEMNKYVKRELWSTKFEAVLVAIGMCVSVWGWATHMEVSLHVLCKWWRCVHS